jgi:hypothetical protein
MVLYAVGGDMVKDSVIIEVVKSLYEQLINQKYLLYLMKQ